MDSRIQDFAAGFSFHRHVRCQHRHFGFCQRVHERLHAPIEFVIADDPGVVIQMIEKIDHERAVRAQTDVGSLVNVADVNQDRISILPRQRRIWVTHVRSRRGRYFLCNRRGQNVSVADRSCVESRSEPRLCSPRLLSARLAAPHKTNRLARSF